MSETLTPAKRITATRVIELMHEERMAVASRPSRERDSFALGRSARGETTVDIKILRGRRGERVERDASVSAVTDSRDAGTI